MEGWQRQLQFPETGLPWVAPSPTCHVLTPRWSIPDRCCSKDITLGGARHDATVRDGRSAIRGGVRFVAGVAALPDAGPGDSSVRFRPTFDKWQQASCGGVALHVVQPHEVRSYCTTLALLAAVQNLWPGQPLWRPPPYEYETEQLPIDLLHGSPRLRRRFERGAVHRDDIEDLAAVDAAAWWRGRTGAPV